MQRFGKTGCAIVLALVAMVFAGMPDSRIGPTAAYAAKSNRIPLATGARLGGDVQRTRFVADISQPVNYNVYVLPDPFRIIVDMDEVNFQLPPGLGQTGQGLIDAYRYGLFAPGKSRIVMDANSPVLIEKSFVLENKNGSPARLVIDIVRTDRATFRQSRRGSIDPNFNKQARLTPDEPVAPPISTVRPRLRPEAPGVKGKKGKPGKSRRRVIVIDPGHGGVDPGAVGPRGTSEKSVVLKFAKTLQGSLQATGRYVVLLTRNKDTFVSLRDRVRFARQRNADLFISVHADSISRGNARGSTVYTLSERASDREAAELAAKENRTDIIAGVDLGEESDEVADILIDLAQRETNNHSVQFAKKLVKELPKATKMTRRPHRFAGFRVLKAPDLPSVLLELGYISSRHDEKLLRSNRWRSKMAKAVVKAVNVYFKTRIARGR